MFTFFLLIQFSVSNKKNSMIENYLLYTIITFCESMCFSFGPPEYTLSFQWFYFRVALSLVFYVMVYISLFVLFLLTILLYALLRLTASQYLFGIFKLFPVEAKMYIFVLLIYICLATEGGKVLRLLTGLAPPHCCTCLIAEM